MKAQPWWYRVGVKSVMRDVGVSPPEGGNHSSIYLAISSSHWVRYSLVGSAVQTNQHALIFPLWLDSQILMSQCPFVSLTSACLCQCWCPLTQSSKVVAKLSPSPPKLTSVFLVISSFLLICFLIWLTGHWNLKDRKYFTKQKHLGITFMALFLWKITIIGLSVTLGQIKYRQR